MDYMDNTRLYADERNMRDEKLIEIAKKYNLTPDPPVPPKPYVRRYL